MGDSLGEYFQRAREAKGLTVEEAAARTRILPQFLKAVEENNYARLPDEVFAKGFVRSYARILGLDEAAVIRKFDESGGQFYAKRAERETLRQQLEEEERRKKVNRNTVVGVVGVALLLLFVLIGRDRDRSERCLNPRRSPPPPSRYQPLRLRRRNRPSPRASPRPVSRLGRSRSNATFPVCCHSRASPPTTGRRWSWTSRPSSGAGPRCRPTMPLPRKCC